MLGKLLKHEFKQSSRIILIILAILVVITPITALYTRFNMNRVPDTDLPFFDIFEALQGIATVLYVCAMIAAAAATTIAPTTIKISGSIPLFEAVFFTGALAVSAFA